MATLKLDDLLGKKKEAPQVLDLSQSTVQSKEEFDRLLDKVPEYKIRPEKDDHLKKDEMNNIWGKEKPYWDFMGEPDGKEPLGRTGHRWANIKINHEEIEWEGVNSCHVRQDDVKVREKDFGFHPTKRENKEQDYAYANPIPPDMRTVPLEDLNPVAIDWKMLTSTRPKSKLEEEMFSRLVTLGKLHLYTAAREKKARNDSSPIHRNKNRAGIIETRAAVCAECGEEFCSGDSCGEFLYESYIRTDIGNLHIDPSGNDSPSGRSSLPKKGRRKSGKKKKKKKQKQSRNAKRKNKGKLKYGNKSAEKKKIDSKYIKS